MTIYPALLIAYLVGAILTGLLVIMNSPVIGIFTEQPGWHGIGLFFHGSQDGYDPPSRKCYWLVVSNIFFHNIWDNPSH